MPGLTVLMFCPQFRPTVGGAERQAERLASALVQTGCSVKILTPRLDALSPERENVDGVAVERFRLVDISKHLRAPGIALLNLPFLLLQVAAHVARRLRGIDVLHCHVGSLQVAGAAIAARLAGVPVICKAAAAGGRGDLGEVEKTGASGSVVAYLLRHLIRTWVATTAAVEKSLVDAGVCPSQIVRIPNGIALNQTKPPPAQACPCRHFLYLGRVSTNSDRDIETLVSAFEQVAAAHTQVELAIVGEGDLLDAIRLRVASSPVRDRIILPGYGDSDRWLNWADCFVLPSRREGLSNALLEAMACGLPCIANDIPPNREVLDDGAAGILVPVGDMTALAEAIRSLCDNPANSAALGQAARRRVENAYSIEHVAAEYDLLYKELLAGIPSSNGASPRRSAPPSDDKERISEVHDQPPLER